MSFGLVMKDELIATITETLTENKEDLETKKSELSEIISETEKEEKQLMKKSERVNRKK